MYQTNIWIQIRRLAQSLRASRCCALYRRLIQKLASPIKTSSSPALVNFSLFIQIYLKMYPVSFPCGLLHDRK